MCWEFHWFFQRKNRWPTHSLSFFWQDCCSKFACWTHHTTFPKFTIFTNSSESASHELLGFFSVCLFFFSYSFCCCLLLLLSITNIRHIWVTTVGLTKTMKEQIGEGKINLEWLEMMQAWYSTYAFRMGISSN